MAETEIGLVKVSAALIRMALRDPSVTSLRDLAPRRFETALWVIRELRWPRAHAGDTLPAFVSIATWRLPMLVPRVLLVANRTATDAPLVGAVRRRARRGPATFHLVVPATPQGLHRVVDPEVAGLDEANRRLRAALPILSEAAGQPVTGHVGDAN